jgi:hypothetical protein
MENKTWNRKYPIGCMPFRWHQKLIERQLNNSTTKERERIKHQLQGRRKAQDLKSFSQRDKALVVAVGSPMNERNKNKHA